MHHTGGIEHRILYARDGELPAGQPWLFIEYDAIMWLVVEARHTAADLEEAWAAFLQIAECA